MTELITFLREKGFDIVPDFSGSVQRFDRAGTTNGWFIGKKLQAGGTEFLSAVFGDWKTSEVHRWTSHDTKRLTAPEREALEQAFAEAMEREREAREKLYEEVAGRCQEKWEGFGRRGSSPYLERKGLPELYGCRLMPTSDDVLTVVPARDGEGKLWTLQYISGEGKKNFASGGRKKGSFHVLGTLDGAKEIYVCEGIATAGSVYTALGCSVPVVTAFDTGNLEPVGREIRARHRDARIVFCADNDRFNATGVNPGWSAAAGAARAVAGEVRLAQFARPESRGTDFNDLHQEEGLDVVREQLTKEPEEGLAPAPVESAEPPAKKKDRFSEKRVADWLLEKYGDTLVRQDKSLFYYEGKRWVELFEADQDKLKNEINALCGDKLTSKDVNSIYKTFFRYVPHVPRGVTLFVPNPACANFEDGTLHLRRNLSTGKYDTEFLPHRKEDYLCWVTPVRYQRDRSVKNDLFLRLLDESFEGDPHKEGKIRSLKQLGGAMLVPAFSQLFFLHGVSGSRKSTIAKVLLKALTTDNVSFLDPGSMEGFMLEALLGKLVNANLDIDDHLALPRNFLKRLEDGAPFPINRKNKPVAHAKMPYVHLYACNKLPPNFEGVSRALERRFTLIEFTRDLTNDNQSGVIKYYEDLVFNHSPEGVYNFMLDGLDDLVNQGGKFTPPASGLQTLRDWQEERDPVAQFLRSVEEGEVGDQNAPVILGSGIKIGRSKLFDIFSSYCREANVDARRINRKGFYAALRARGYQDYKGNPDRYFLGIGVRGSPEAAGEAAALNPSAAM